MWFNLRKFFTLAQISKNRCQITSSLLGDSLRIVNCRFFLSQIEKLFEIKPPLVIGFTGSKSQILLKRNQQKYKSQGKNRFSLKKSDFFAQTYSRSLWLVLPFFPELLHHLFSIILCTYLQYVIKQGWGNMGRRNIFVPKPQVIYKPHCSNGCFINYCYGSHYGNGAPIIMKLWHSDILYQLF